MSPAESIVAAGAVGAIVSVDGEVHTAGLANLETGEPLTPRHRFRIGSIDKVFMALVALDVFDDLDVAAAAWLPELDERITLRRLLTHRSGLFNWGREADPSNPVLPPPEQLLRDAVRHPLGELDETAYSNTNYTALQLILERETGERLGDLVRRIVIAPLGLASTTIHEERTLPPGVAHGYALDDARRDASEDWADGSIASDAADLDSFFRRVPPDLPGLRDYDGAYGHGGTMPGYATQVLVRGDRVAVVAANSQNLPVTLAVRQLARDLVFA